MSDIEMPEEIPSTSRRSTRLASRPVPAADPTPILDEQEEYENAIMDVIEQGYTEEGFQVLEGDSDSTADDDDQGSNGSSRSSTRSKLDGTIPFFSRKGVTTTFSDPVDLLSQEEMVHNCLFYLLLNQYRRIPAKKSDIVKNAMNGQIRSLEAVFQELEVVLPAIFGFKAVGLGEAQQNGLFSHYILISNYSLSVCDMVTPRYHDVDCRRSVLFLILAVIFMLNRSIDEDLIWKIMSDTKLNMLVCEKKENLRRYLKQEFVSTKYLTKVKDMEETQNSDPPVLYSWGCRAEKEFSKYGILKFVTKQFPGKRHSDFTVQYGIAKDQEADLVNADVAVEEQEREAAAAAAAAAGELGDVESSFTDDEDDDLLTQQLVAFGACDGDEETLLQITAGPEQNLIEPEPEPST